MTRSKVETLAVCFATFNRHDGVRGLLAALEGIDGPAPGVEWTKIVVVDNSADGNAGAVVESIESIESQRVEIVYAHEPEPGISAARNRALEASGTDLIAFVDDDEVPAVNWLFELSRAFVAAPDAVAAMGPVRFKFETEPPRWASDSGVFDVIEMTPGEPPEYLATGNLLLRTDLRDILGALFDPRFGLTGGEDHHLGLRIERAGLQVVSAPDAIVTEIVESHRISHDWVETRLRRKGGALAATELSIDPSVRTRAKHVLQGVARIGVGLTRIAAAPVTRETSWRGRKFLLMGVGQLKASLGNLPTAEYER